MKLIRTAPGTDPDGEIAALIAVLQKSARRLEDLTGGKVETTADRAGRTLLLRHAKDHLRINAAARQAAVLDALPAHTALLDGDGRIVSVNEAWRLFDGGNSILSPGYGLDSNYLEILDAARGADASAAREVAEGIRSVLDGAAGSFAIEYPCHSKTRDRWFLLSTTPLAGERGMCAVVMHLDITAQRRGEEALRRFGAAIDVIHDAVYLVDRASMRFVHVNQAACRMQGRTREEIFSLGPDRILSVSRSELAQTYDALIASGEEAEPIEMLRPRKGAPDAWVELRRHAVRSGDRWTIVTLVRDISEQMARRGELQRFRAAMDISGDAILLINRATLRYIDVNQTFCNMVGRTRQEMLGLTPMDVFSADRQSLERAYDALIADNANPANCVEGEYRHSDGTVIPVESRRHAMRTEQGWVIVATARDITERREAQGKIVALNRVYAMLSGINALIVRVHERDELFREACRIAVEAGGFRTAIICSLDRKTATIVPSAAVGVDAELMSAIEATLASPEIAPTTMIARAMREKRAIVSNASQTDPQALLRDKHSESGVRSLVVLPLIVADEAMGVLTLYSGEADFFQEEELKLVRELAGEIALAIDRVDKQAKLDYLAYYDALTGLANRSLFLERMSQYMRSAVEGGHGLAMFLVDLERFKNINDSLGQTAGDALLRQVAQWLTRNTGDVNLLARIGADQFALVLPKIKTTGDLARLLETTQASFNRHPFRVDETDLRISAKVGVALFPEDGENPDALYKSAEAALKKAKATGEKYLFYAQKMTATVAGTLTLENQLRHALDKEEFVLHYQPKANLVSGRLTGVEALIRWNDPQTGLVPPGSFIPILEETGLIHDVGRWALGRAIADYLRWQAAGLPAVRIAVNVSPLQLRNRAFVAEIERAVGIDPQAASGLELEITESLIMADVPLSIASLKAIRALGVTVAIDDFGTGFSSLSHLARLPVDTLKIDRSFVIDMTDGPQGLALVSTIINLAHSLKLKVVAEGVETEEQSRLLRLLSCDEMQGYLFSKAVPADAFEARFLATAGAGLPRA